MRVIGEQAVTQVQYTLRLNNHVETYIRGNDSTKRIIDVPLQKFANLPIGEVQDVQGTIEVRVSNSINKDKPLEVDFGPLQLTFKTTEDPYQFNEEVMLVIGG